MKENDLKIGSAILTSLWLNTLLGLQAQYWSWAGFTSGAFSVLLLLAVLRLFGFVFPQQNRFFRAAFSLVFSGCLLCGAALEITGLAQLYGLAYPDTTLLAGVFIAVTVPLLYLRERVSLARTADIALLLLCAAVVLLLVSVGGRLHPENLQTPADTQNALQAAFGSQLLLYPEYFMPIVWIRKKPQQIRQCRGIVVGAIGFNVLFHLLLELFYGNAFLQLQSPVHTLACSGAISIFNRMEWLQLIFWTMAVAVKLALYLSTLVKLFQRQKQAAVSYRQVACYAAALAVLCIGIRKWDLQALYRGSSAWLWGVTLICIAGGLFTCAFKKIFSKS